MTLTDAKKLIASPHINKSTSQIWADLGCGDGLFSNALINMLADKSVIYAIDKSNFTPINKQIIFYKKDFEKDDLPLPKLDGIMMINALHFIKEKILLLQKLKEFLKPSGLFLLGEYDTTSSNRWVPYPLSFSEAVELFTKAGFNKIEKINEKQSVYNRSKIYTAIIYN
jgi:SAM-dependent methyltransferase